VAAVRGWITGRISEARWLAEQARAAACDIDDRAVSEATVRLDEDLEAFAATLPARLVESEAF
jgi:hypothetical protein